MLASLQRYKAVCDAELSNAMKTLDMLITSADPLPTLREHCGKLAELRDRFDALVGTRNPAAPVPALALPENWINIKNQTLYHANTSAHIIDCSNRWGSNPPRVFLYRDNKGQFFTRERDEFMIKFKRHTEVTL